MAAATSALVDSGLEAHRAGSAPPATGAGKRLAVSVVTCRQGATRRPSNGRVRSSSAVTARSTGMRLAANSTLAPPSGARARSFSITSIDDPLVSAVSARQAQQPPRLAGLVVQGCRPGLLAAAPLRGTAPAGEAGEGAQAPGQLPLGEGAQREPERLRGDPVPGRQRVRVGRGEQVALGVDAVVAAAPLRADQAELLGVAQHARRRAEPRRGLPDVLAQPRPDPVAPREVLQLRVHGRHATTLTFSCKGWS